MRDTCDNPAPHMTGKQHYDRAVALAASAYVPEATQPDPVNGAPPGATVLVSAHWRLDLLDAARTHAAIAAAAATSHVSGVHLPYDAPPAYTPPATTAARTTQ